MKVAHKDKTENNGANAKELDLVVALNATGEIIRDDTVKFDD